jgi:hypothetical protein
MSEPKYTGSIRLEVDESGLEARLVFTPRASDKEWDTETLKKFLTEQNITEGIDTKVRDSVIADMAKQPETRGDGSSNIQTVTIAQGTPAVDPLPEEVQWQGITLPEEMKDDIERFLQDVDAPIITKEVVEKVKVKKKVLKKQKLPFMQPKEEIEEVVEKRKKQLPVDVDPTVEEYGWVEEGQKIAAVVPAKPGKPGKDVHGTPIMPLTETEPGLYPGKGTVKEKSDVIAAESGVLRRGKNWVEVLPFSRHEWSVSLSKDHATCFFTFRPGSKFSTPPTPNEVLEEIRKLEYPEDKLKPLEEIEQQMFDAIDQGKPIEQAVISKDSDSVIDISISEDKMKATLTLRKGRGAGKPLVLKEVGEALRKSGLKGIKLDTFKKDVLEFYRSKQESLEEYVLLEGTPPEEPEDGEIQFNVTFLPEEERERLKEMIGSAESGRFPGISSFHDFHTLEVEEMAKVVRHQTVAKIVPGKKGKDGKDIFGNTVESRPPKEAEVKLFENFKNEQGVIHAEISGLLEKGNHAGTVLLRILPYRDGEAEVTVTEDKMRAYLSLSPAEGMGTTPDRELVDKKLAEAGVKEGIDEDTVAKAVEACLSGESVTNLLVAKGKPPQHASEKKLELYVTLPSNKKVTIKKDGRADYKTHSDMVSVKEGELIAKILPPEVNPEDGRDVTGKTIQAKTTKGFDLQVGKNIKEEPQDDGSIHLIAESDGKLIYDKKNIEIQSTHIVDGNVDMKSGNIKFKGAVQIKGSVETGFYVVSGDAVSIKEGVEAAFVSCDKELIIGQGVKGAGKAVLRTKSSIKAAFIERATLLSVGDINIKNFCLQSTVKCNGKMVLETEKGSLIGGYIQAKKGLEVMNLGAKNGMKTEVFFGQDYLVADQIQVEEKEIEKLKKKTLEYDNHMNRLEKNGERGKLEKVRKEKLKLLKIMEKRSYRLFTFRERFEEHFPSEIKIRGILYPGVIVESHGRYYEAKDEKKSIKLVFDQEIGQIKEEPLTN